MPDPRYRVLFIASHAVQYQSPIFRRLAVNPELDIHVAYCTLKGAEAAVDPEFGAKIQWDIPLLDGYPWSEVPNRGSGRESFFGLCNPGLWKLIHGGNYDAVICYVSYVRASFWIARAAAKLSNAAFLFGTDAVTRDPLHGWMWKRAAKRVAWPVLFQMVNQVMVSSSRTHQFLTSLGIPPEQISLTPATVDNEWWASRASETGRGDTRRAWGATENDIVFLFCAKLQPWKRPFDLLHAFALANISESILLFAGEGPLRAALEKEAVSLGISSRVHFLGFVNQSHLPAIYSAADLMVLPSSHENFGFVINEAMCCGCPVMVSDCVGAGPDLIAPVNPGFIFPVGDVDAIARLLRDATTDRPRLREIGRRCVAHMQSWSPEQNIASTVKAVRIAVARKRKGSSQALPGVAGRQPSAPEGQKLHK